MTATPSDAVRAVTIARGPLKGLICNVVEMRADDQLLIQVPGITGVFIQLDRALVDELPEPP